MAEALAATSNPYRQEFDAGRDAPAWAAELQSRGMQAFDARGFPGPRDEAWRRTNLRAVTGSHFARADATTVADAEASRIAALGEGVRVIFVNGVFDADLSDIRDLPSGLTVAPFSAYAAEAPARLTRSLGARVDGSGHAFAALNTALFRDGLFVHAGRGVVVEQPVIVVHVTTADAHGRAVYPRLLVDAEHAAQLTVVEHYLGDEQAAALVAPVTEVLAGDGAVVDHYRIQEEGGATRHFGVLHMTAARDASVRGFCFSRGAIQARVDVTADLDDTGADIALNGLYLTSGRQFSDHHTWVNHRQPHGTSRQVFKGILQGRSETVFDGLVKVFEGAQKTDAQQQNRNLLLERMALAHSNPRLEIHADDVKCAHGSTVGELDEDALFYLRSRGVGAEDAQGLLTLAFASELLAEVRPQAVADYLRRRLLEALPGDDTLRDVL
jgi:Fe-S cluster assembly protein SufD